MYIYIHHYIHTYKLHIYVHVDYNYKMMKLTIFILGAASLTNGSLLPFLNAVTLIVCGCFLY